MYNVWNLSKSGNPKNVENEAGDIRKSEEEPVQFMSVHSVCMQSVVPTVGHVGYRFDDCELG